MKRLAAVLTASLLCLAAGPAAAQVPPELPATDRFCVSVIDSDGKVLGRIDIAENASRMPRPALREKVGYSIRGLASSGLVGRPDVAQAVSMIVLPGDDALADGQGGVVCTCSKLECADPTVCGVSCKGPCEDCLRCVLVRAGSPIRWRPKK